MPDAELWMVCQDAPAAPNVRVFGRVSDAELAELYGAAWIFCLPSSYEGFGIPYIEAMASGTPVVATPNPGAREVTEDGAVGVLTSEADLGISLLNLLQSDSDRSALALKARAAAQKYDLGRVAGEYEDLYLTHRPRRTVHVG